MEAKKVVRIPRPKDGQVTRSQLNELVAAAQEVRRQAYAPYSRFLVGSAILASDGSIYRGCNVENSSYGLSSCAERNAVHAMIAAGQRRLVAVAVVTQSTPPSPPCGTCRQVLSEFAPDAVIVLVNTRGDREQTTLGKIFPKSFGPDYL